MPEVISNKEQAAKKIAELTGDAREKIRTATELADIWGVEFSWNLAYGMGGRYAPQHRDDSKWDESDAEWSTSDDYSEDGWRSSSQSC